MDPNSPGESDDNGACGQDSVNALPRNVPAGEAVVVKDDTLVKDRQQPLPVRWIMQADDLLTDESSLAISVENHNAWPVVAVANECFPWKGDTNVFYYEVKISRLVVGGTMALGLTAKRESSSPLGYPGWQPGSHGLHSVGELFSGSIHFYQKRQRSFSPPFSPRDTIGCGWCPHKRSIFFTLNGKLLGVAFHLSNDEDDEGDGLYPVIGFRSAGVAVVANFGASPFLWQGHTVNSTMRSEFDSGRQWSASLENAQNEFNKLLESNELIHRSTNMPRRLIMKALRKGKQKYLGFTSSGGSNGGEVTDESCSSPHSPRKSREYQSDEEDNITERSPLVTSSTSLKTVDRTYESNEGTAAKLKSHLDDFAFKMGAKIVSMISPGPVGEEESDAFYHHSRAEDSGGSLGNFLQESDFARLVAMTNELCSLEEQLGHMEEVDRAVLTQLEDSSKELRQRLYNLICETKDDAMLGDLLSLNDRLFTLIDDMEKFKLSKTLEMSIGDAMVETDGTGGRLRANSSGGVSIDYDKAEDGEDGQLVVEDTSYGLSEGTADSVRELLFFLRSGDEQAQMNAARALSYLVRDHERNAEIRAWSQVDACEGGGIGTLVEVLNSHRADSNAKLRHAIAAALSAIASGSWINIKGKTCSLDHMHPSTVADSFETDLRAMLDACRILMHQRCYCCTVPTWPLDQRYAGCAFTQREACLAIANLCLIFCTRDRLMKLFSEVESEWVVIMAEDAISLLVEAVNSSRPVKHDNLASECTNEDFEEKLIAWDESRQLATFALSTIARYGIVRQTVLERGVLPPLVEILKSQMIDSDELLLHSVSTIYSLCNTGTSILQEEDGEDEKCYILSPTYNLNQKAPQVDLVTVGFVVAQLISTDALPALIALTDRVDELPNSVRCMTIACFSSLSALAPCLKVLIQMNGVNALFKLGNFEQSAIKERFRSHGSSSASSGSNGSSNALNASSTIVRRRMSSASVDVPDKEPATSKKVSRKEKVLELRHFAATLYNFASSSAAVKSVANYLIEHPEVLVSLCKEKDVIVQLYTVRAILPLTESDDCDRLEKQTDGSISRSITELLARLQLGGQHKSANCNEVLLDASLILANLANGESMLTRAHVAKSGGLKHSVFVLRRLYGLEEHDNLFKGIESSTILQPVIKLLEPRGIDIEIAHQAVRVVAGLVELVGSKPSQLVDLSFSLWQDVSSLFMESLDAILLVGVLLLGSPASVVQCEAARVLGAITRCQAASTYKLDIARLALPKLVQLSVGGIAGVEFPDRQLQLRAEDVLVGLGFSGGVNDVELCGRHVGGLFDWLILTFSLEHQELMHAAFLSAAFVAWQLSLKEGTMQKQFRSVTGRSDLVRSISLYEKSSPSKIEKKRQQSFDVARRVDEDDIAKLFTSETEEEEEASPSRKKNPMWLRRLAGCGMRPASLAGLEDEDTVIREFKPLKTGGKQTEELLLEEYISSAESRVHGLNAKREIAMYFGSLIDTEANHEENQSSFKLKLANDLNPGTHGLIGSLPTSCRVEFEANFPSRLHQRLLSLPSRDTPGDEDVNLMTLLPRRPLAISIKRSQGGLSFRFGRIVQKLLSSFDDSNSTSDQHIWSMCFPDCDFVYSVPGFHDNLMDCLFRFPVITSVSFISSESPGRGFKKVQKGLFSSIVRNLPSSVTWCTFDNTLSPSELADIVNCFEARRNRVALQGLALRNCNFRYSDILCFIRLLAPRGALNMSSGKLLWLDAPRTFNPQPAHTLRWVDLSGNKLGDSGCARVIEAIAMTYRFGGTVESIDLSYNGIGSYAKETIGALIGEKRPGGLFSTAENEGCIYELHLSHNGIGNGAICKLLTHLAQFPGKLRALILDGNDLGKDKKFEDALSKYLNVNTTLFELSLSGNHLSESCGKDLRFSIANSCCHFFVCAGNPELREEDVIEIESALSVNRQKWVQQSLTGVVTVDKSDTEAQTFLTAPSEDLPISEEMRPRLSVLFSAPLALRDARGQLFPIQSIDYEREKDILWQTFTEASRDIDLSFGFATTDRLRSEVTMRCRAIHYSGHGSENALLFEDRGAVHTLDIESLRRLASGGDSGSAVQFVFVSACYSEYAGRAFVEAGVPHVVCAKVNARILDKAAHAFTRAFYLSLAIGDTVRTAFEIARQAVDVLDASQSTETAVSEKFLLLPEDTDHDVSIFANRRVISFWPPENTMPRTHQEHRRKLWRGGHVPAVPEDFLGRGVDTYSTLAAVLTRRIVSVTGKSGIGKTSLAKAVVNYANDRNMFRDGVLFLRLEGTLLISSLVNMLTEMTVFPTPKPKDDLCTDEIKMERLYDALRYRKFILVLDCCDELMQRNTKFRHFVGRLLDEIKGIRLLLTCQNQLGRVPGYAVTLKELGPLSPRCAAQLFVRLSPHNQNQMIQISGKRYGLLDAIAGHSILKSCLGSPGAIHDKAYSLQEHEFVKMIHQCRIVVENVRNVRGDLQNNPKW
uniref:B30.2/SPRY domain-containing protein n=1 Tax=Mucochytrium quahogii TaxID=96639 RepID=A0A7S2RUY4_9STRA|mmetsp:Transcript_9108/g.17162  ORF Transcript_9108/g.17162 Transcript_9108/m.17162 type:complete len:2467 (-) Transcript_9108:3690-11090(-)|eukprot:CAMPEP_0203763070 /NCGR_PEP_ID=MMETSP0098-20131031/15770_1 /ASSEMBLY_ACC=CAM_ASM_000208 /TAXON_ID=96639 /ORGANISM=" , Strain NY0313808BC1" /LENGTH=2466 /DNA_ID=CAMNT_0050657673 /DNA_START=291 /DNA_END=7691 /DNA_ORIENTATION=+